MLGVRSLRRVSQVGWPQSISGSLGAASSTDGVSNTRGSGTYTVEQATNIRWFEGGVPREAKEQQLGQRGCILWFTGLSGSGKSTVAATVEHALVSAGHATALLDGDNVRHGLNCDLGFCAADRAENIRRIGEVSRLFVQTGLITLVAFISPYHADRQRVRERVAPGDFIEVYMRVPLDVCEKRDPKGLYKKARAGQCRGFTGIDDPYEEPQSPELILDVLDAHGEMQSVTAMANTVLQYLHRHDYLRAHADPAVPQPLEALRCQA